MGLELYDMICMVVKQFESRYTTERRETSTTTCPTTVNSLILYDCGSLGLELGYTDVLAPSPCVPVPGVEFGRDYVILLSGGYQGCLRATQRNWGESWSK